MNAPRWDFLLFMTSVAGAATPALGQTVGVWPVINV
jgi:hypothetical protein